MNAAAAFLFEDDSGIMSEVETASTTRLRRAGKERTPTQSNYVPLRPRTSPGRKSFSIGNGCSTMVEQSSLYQEVVGSNPSKFSVMLLLVK